MDPTSVVILGRLVICCLMAVAAVITLHYGFKTYNVRSQVGAETSDIKFGNVHLSSNSAGVFVMGLSVFWVIGVVSVTPDYWHNGDSANVAAAPVEVQFETAVLGTVISASSEPVSAGTLATAFTASATAAEHSQDGWVT